jgi:dimethylhistidine N-methyltransferase
MGVARKTIRIDSEADARAAFARDVVAGLSRKQKAIPPKYFYDERGSELFEAITRTPEYYPTRTELSILEMHGREIAQHIPVGAALVEFGSGSSAKIRTLLRALDKLQVYVPVDISPEFLAAEAASLQADFPHLSVLPVAADFTRPFALPAAAAKRPRAGFFPGSTIGNFEPREAGNFLRHVANVLGKGSVFIVGADLVKDERVLHDAYNDAEGVTAAFNLNLLARMKRELGADFDPDSFGHRAFFNPRQGRIEMHLESKCAQRITVCGRAFHFTTGETIHTECSYKYTVAGFAALAGNHGWSLAESWVDSGGLFSIHALICK